MISLIIKKATHPHAAFSGKKIKFYYESRIYFEIMIFSVKISPSKSKTNK